jgi:hypothetical protein
MMNVSARYADSVAFIRQVDDDWARLIDQVGPCRHDPKAAREPYEALVRAIAYQHGHPIARSRPGIFGECHGSSPTFLEQAPNAADSSVIWRQETQCKAVPNAA